MPFTIERFDSGAGAICRAILDDLAPEWFGVPASNAAFAEEAEAGPAWIAFAAQSPVGVMVLRQVSEDAMDIHVIAVRRAHHRGGIGRAFIAVAEDGARRAGCALVSVKTRGPSGASEEYERTRLFYRGVGFRAVEEFTEIWGPENPCLIMVKALTPPSG
ncbi:MAG TPA: GNAT family N-acetyltransferase [Caulobacterales bacterium]|jgi:GNAT superfamily N-acetyltransferase|nr:GNAT family N-acetyltransferase [Caulobacterales bacterium]